MSSQIIRALLARAEQLEQENQPERSEKHLGIEREVRRIIADELRKVAMEAQKEPR